MQNESKANKKDWFDNLSSEEKEGIEIGLKQAENDEFISHKAVMNRFAKYHQKNPAKIFKS